MLAWLASGLFFVGPRIARADDAPVPRAECLRAYESSQLQRRSQALLKARQELRICTAESCPALARTDCITWLSEVDATIPTVVVEGKSDSGPVFDVTVAVDGQIVASTLEGKPIELDPGLHTLIFERPGEPRLEQKIIVREREKSRRVVADWTVSTPSSPVAPAPTGPTFTDRPIPLSVLILAGVGAAGAADFAIAGLLGNAKKASLESSSCAPFCAADDVSAVRARYLVADVGLGVSAAALVAGAVLFATRPARVRAARLASFELGSFGSGALAGYHGQF